MTTYAEKRRYRKYRRIAQRRQETVYTLEEWKNSHITKEAPYYKSSVRAPACEASKESSNDNMESSKPKRKNSKDTRSSTQRTRHK